METLISQLCFQPNSSLPLIPSTINKPKSRTKQSQLNAKRKKSGGGGGGGAPPPPPPPLSVSVSQLKSKLQEEATQLNGKSEEDSDEIPEKVFDRMLQRISISVGVPIGSGTTLIYVLDKLTKANIYEPPPWLPFFILLVTFGSGALAMAYGTLSTSWDPDKEGSFFGFEQIEKNWPVLWKEELDKKNM
ncbi:transmembrane protein, putative (DUF3464) [Carex rostrata]